MNRRILTLLFLVFTVSLWSPTAHAQDVTITNLSELAEMAFSPNSSLYLPWMPWEWRAYPLDSYEPWWVDCSQLTCGDLLSTSTNPCATLQMHGITVTSVVLTKNILTGETLLHSGCSTDVIAIIPAPSGYEPGAQLGENVWVWHEWQQVTNCLDCWGLTNDDIPPPVVTLKARLADATMYSVFASNVEAEAEAAAAAWTSSVSSFSRGSRFMTMEDDISCTITDEALPFSVTDIERETNGYTTVTWTSCSDHIYGVLSADTLSTNTQWTGRAAMWGDDGSTSWTDTTSGGATNRFYKIVRMAPDGDFDGDGLPNWWELQYGLNLFDPGDGTNDADGDGYSNFDEFLMGTNPTNSNDPITVYVDNANTNGVYDGTQTHPFQNIQDAIESTVDVSSNLAVRVKPGTYYETVSNLQYDPTYGYVVSSRQYLYIYAANTNWSLSTDPETHVIDALDLPNEELVDLTLTPAPVVELNDVSQARINGFTIRGGQGPYGAGILAYSSTDGPIYISNCIIEKNGSTDSYAGGVYLWAGTNSLIYNTVIAKNTGTIGAVFDVNGSHIWNCTIISNVTVDSTAGAVTGYSGAPNIRNSIVWNDGIDLYFADVDYSTFGSNEFTTLGFHNISDDPQLVTIPFGNYRLAAGSTLIGAGTPLSLEQQDLYGNSRPSGSRFDIGANRYTDSDGDGMQDDWEIKHSLNPASSADATGNTDGDGSNNLQEYNRHSDPHNGDTDGDGIPDDLDPDPTTPDVLLNTVFWDGYFASQFETYIDGVASPQWINEPITRPRAVVLTNKHIGDHVNLQWQYLGGPGFQPFLVFYVPQAPPGSIVPDVNAVPLDQIQFGTGVFAPPGGPWGFTIGRMLFTNADVCAGFDDETPKYFNFTDPALSVPQHGSNTFTAIINPTNVYNQVFFDTLNSLVTVSPTTASSASQLLSVTGNTVTSDVVRILAYGAQNTFTTVTAIADIDVLPKKTNVTVALYRVTASSTPTIVPTNVPSASELKSYLDGLFGKQANVFMTVLNVTNITVNYDLNGNTNLDWNTPLSSEQRAITGAVYNASAINIYYVEGLFNSSEPNAVGLANPATKSCWISQVTVASNVNVTAHEIGHVFGLGHPNNPGERLTGDPDRLMWEGVTPNNNPCRLIRREWLTVNGNAQ